MSWNYRIFRLEHEGEPYHQIREAYYENGKLTAYSANPIHPQGETPAALQAELILMEQAFGLPVLTEESAVGSKAPPRSKKGPPGAALLETEKIVPKK